LTPPRVIEATHSALPSPLHSTADPGDPAVAGHRVRGAENAPL